MAKSSFSRLVFVLAFSFYVNTAFSQVVNIESQRIQSDTLGWFGNIGSNFSLTKNVNQIVDIGAVAHAEYKYTKGLWLFLVNYNLLKTDTQQFNNNAFAHVRYNANINHWLVWEAFAQWQENVVEGIGTRALIGTGPRFTLSHAKIFRLFAGTAVLYEYERDVKGYDSLHHDMRNDTYVSCTYKPTSNVTIISTVYYQPLFTRIADFRILHDLTVRVNITRRFAFLLSWDFQYDAFPAYEVPQVTYTLTNGLTYAFKK